MMNKSWHALCFYQSRRNKAAMVSGKKRSVSSAPASCAGFPEKARRFFFKTVSARYGNSEQRKQKDEVFVGYESSWPPSYKKLH